MCGFLLTTDTTSPFTHEQMRGLSRRGPDGLGFYVDRRVRIAHARLAVVGLDERGVQPIENDRYVLAFNGEIYNWQELRDALDLHMNDGLPTDAHVLLEMWTHEGPSCLEKLSGFWAFALYDKRSGDVVLCRDPFGIKPLYRTTSGPLKAASTITALEHRGELDLEALSEYVRYQFTFGDKTFFRGVKKISPGEIVTVGGNGSIDRRTYADPWSHTGSGEEPLTDAWVDETREILRAAVLESRTSDAGFTTFCSGGLDSGLVTRIAQPTHAWHCNYADPECNETFYARETYAPLLVHNADERPDLVARLTSLVEDFDELSIGAVILPLDELMTRVRARGDKVILTGTGGDELFGGYVRHQLTAGTCLHESYRGMFDRMRGCATPAERFEVAHAKGAPVYRFAREISVRRTFLEAFRDPIDFDRRHFLPGLLNIDDRIAGRHGLESRPSLLHPTFVRRMMEIAPPVLPELKAVGKQIAEGIVPESVLRRRDKMGFTTPIGAMVNADASKIREFITSSPFRQMYDLDAIRWTTEPGAGKFDRQVFGLLLLDAWLRRHATSPSTDK